MPDSKTEHRPGRAIALKLGAVFLFIVMAALIKTASATVPTAQAVFFRSFCAIPVIALWLWQQGHLHDGLIPQNVMGHVWRGVFGTTAMGLTFSALALLPLPEVTAIGFATPMFTVVLAALMLGERVRVFRLSAVVIGLIGVSIILYPRLGGASYGTAAATGALMALAAAALRALVQIHVRRLVSTEQTGAIVFYFSLTASALSLLVLPIGYAFDIHPLTWAWPGTLNLTLVVTAGVIGAVAQIMVTSSYRFGAASMLAPFDYASMLYAVLIGWVIFAEVPTAPILLGAALVIAGGVLILWRERQLGLERAPTKGKTPPHGTPG